jgi:hypothetical protein
MLQMAGAASSLALLFFSGLSTATIVATAATTALAAVSFAWHHRRNGSRHPANLSGHFPSRT